MSLNHTNDISLSYARLLHMDATGEKKKKPGRPRKKADAQTLPTHGICAEPSTTGVVCEFACTDIEVVKKTIALQKTCNAIETEFYFAPDSFRVSSVGHSGKIELITTFDCSVLHRYYCKEPIAIKVTRVYLDKIIDNLNKSHDVVWFTLKEDYRRYIYCVLCNTVRKSIKTCTIPTAYNGEPKIIPAVDEDYPLSFNLPSKELKANMASLKLISPLLVIQKTGDGPMQLTCESNQDVDWEETFFDGAPLGMHCTLGADDIIRVTVFADLVKSFAQHVIGVSTLLKVDQVRPLILTSHVCVSDRPVVTVMAIVGLGSRATTA